MSTITLAEVDGVVHFTAPYNRKFPALAHTIAGTWDTHNEHWVFSPEALPELRELVRQIYGWTEPVVGETATIRMTFTGAQLSLDEYYLAGQRIFYRATRDAEVRVPNNVSVIDGRLPRSGGTRIAPQIMDESYEYDTVTLEIRDIALSELDPIDHPYIRVPGREERFAALEAEKADFERIYAKEPAGQLF